MQHKLLFKFDRQVMVKFQMHDLELSVFSREIFLFDIVTFVYKLD